MLRAERAREASGVSVLFLGCCNIECQYVCFVYGEVWDCRQLWTVVVVQPPSSGTSDTLEHSDTAATYMHCSHQPPTGGSIRCMQSTMLLCLQRHASHVTRITQACIVL